MAKNLDKMNIVGTEIGQNSDNKRYYSLEFAEEMGYPIKFLLQLIELSKKNKDIVCQEM